MKFQCSRGRPVVPLISGDLLLQANNLASRFKSYSIPALPIHTDDVSNALIFLSPIELTCGANEDYNLPISLSEVEFAISNCRKLSAPGPDGIGYAVFKKFSDVGIQLLTILYNRCFTTGCFPDSFHGALVMALPKSTPNDFRPITLSNAVAKLLDRIIYIRLVKIIDPILPEWQFGFRSKRGAADQLLKFYSTLQQQRARGRHVAILFLDIKKAFDRVCRTRLLLELYEQGVQGKLLQAISNLLSIRSVRVINDRIVSDEFFPEEGTPQGGVSSPLLWNFFFRGVGDSIQRRYARLPSFLKGYGLPELFGFADDAAVVVTGTSKKHVFSLLSEAYTHIRKWCCRNRVELSDSKVKSMYISPSLRSKRDRENNGEAVRYFDSKDHPCAVDEVLEYKYLGALIDSKLSLKSWCLRICQNIIDRIAFIRRLDACGKLGRARMEKLYKGYVRGYMNYGAFVWSQGSKKEVEMIYAADRKGLRMCCRAILRTSTVSLLEESNIESYADTLKRMGLLYSLKLLQCPELASVMILACDSDSKNCALLVLQLWMDSILPLTNLDMSELQKR